MTGFVRASHPAPTLAVTFVITAFAWGVGWRWPGVGLLASAVLVGQLSVGWSNDAFDAGVDALAQRRSKPTVSGQVSARALWLAAGVALVASSAMSWAVAGPVGGTFHVFSLAMAWTYNTVLSRTSWSWLPYALAFGAVPPFVTFGLDGSAPPAWTVVLFSVVGVSAHLANALPDITSDREAGLDGLAIRLGPRRSAALCWALLGFGTAVIVGVTAAVTPALAVVAATAYLGAMLASTRSARASATFHALIAVVVVDVVLLVLAVGWAG